MNHVINGSITIFFYLASASFLIAELKCKKSHNISVYFAWAAVIPHALYNAEIFIKPTGIDFSFFNTASLISFIVVLILLTATVTKPVIKLGIVVFPVVSLILFLGLTMKVQPQIIDTQSWQMNIHILTSITAFSLLTIASFQALLLAVQHRQLRSHRPHHLIHSLPPLQTMESLLFQMIGTGVIFLSASLISGFMFIEDLFAQHLVHKTVLSIFAWVTFSGLLIGRSIYGWRGQTAIRWTLIGFISLALAYFGSKLVLELILKR